MPQISDSGTDELYQAPTFDDILFKIHCTDSTTVLERLHCTFIVELQFQSSHPNGCDNPEFFNLTDKELAVAARKIFTKVMDISSCMRMAYYTMRYVKRCLNRVSPGSLVLFSDMYEDERRHNPDYHECENTEADSPCDDGPIYHSYNSEYE